MNQFYREHTLKYKRTKKGLIGIIYRNQITKTKIRKKSLPSYTLKELREWALKQPIYHTLFNNWVDSNCDTNLVPSFDRIKADLDYTLNNLQIITWRENNEKGKSEKQTIGKLGKKIICTEIKTGQKTIYLSQREASRKTGVNVASISLCLNNKQKKTIEYLWKYN